MSYEKLKNIRIADLKVYFDQKSSNTTGDYYSNSCDIPSFLHLSWGNCFQFSHKRLNEIVKNYISKLNKIIPESTINDMWFDLSMDINKIDGCTPEIRSLFFKTCDKINNLK